MSDIDRSRNILDNFFTERYNIFDKRKKPLTTVYFSYASSEKPVLGTVYLMHGYGGSPLEPFLKQTMITALNKGFDVVAIESVALSATSGTEKKLVDMNLSRHKHAIVKGLEACEANKKLCHEHKVAWVHSLSGRALSDLTIHFESVRNYFDEFVLNNPYFLSPKKLQNSKNKSFAKDPTGKSWYSLSWKQTLQKCFVEDIEYKVPASIRNFEIPLPRTWKLHEDNYNEITDRISEILNNPKITFILGTNDDKAEYGINRKLFQALKVADKQLVTIEGAGHYFENALEDYYSNTNIIFNNIISNLSPIKTL